MSRDLFWRLMVNVQSLEEKVKQIQRLEKEVKSTQEKLIYFNQSHNDSTLQPARFRRSWPRHFKYQSKYQ